MLPWHETGIYDHPEDFGLKILAETRIEPAPHSEECPGGFDMIVIWKAEDGRLLIGTDAGCACPTPFENTRVDELSEIHTADDVRYFVWDVWQTIDDESVDEQISELLTGAGLAER